MLILEEKMFKDIGLGLNKHWFSQTTKCVPMISCIYFTVTRNIMASDIVDVFENILNIGIVHKEYINIVPVLNNNYNHVFLKIQWNDTIETANFVNEILVHSSVKVYHNKGYWVCRMSKNPLKMRTSKRSIKVASFYCDDSESESEEYFATRPWSSQIGAWASAQSQPLESRAELESRFAGASEKWPEGTTVPRPPHWGGYRIAPLSIEFWQGRYSRLHDRLRYERQTTDSEFVLTRYYP